MRPRQASQFQISEDSLGNINRKIVPRLRRALRIVRSITEADLTESRPILLK